MDSWFGGLIFGGAYFRNFTVLHKNMSLKKSLKKRFDMNIQEKVTKRRKQQPAQQARGSSGRKREWVRAMETPSPLACLLLARPFFLVPTTSKRLLRKLRKQISLFHPGSKMVESAELRKPKHEKKKTKQNKTKTEGNWVKFLFHAPPTFNVPLTFASSPLSDSLEQAKIDQRM